MIKRNEGFTLLELVMVMVLLMGLLSIAVPTLRDMNRFGTREASNILMSDLQLARMIAIRNHSRVTVTFNNPVGGYTMNWTDRNGVAQSRSGFLKGGIQFENLPPGGLVPDAQMIFTQAGFIQTPGGPVPGNICLVNQDNTNRYNITTTFSGTIDERRWDASAGQWNVAY